MQNILPIGYPKCDGPQLASPSWATVLQDGSTRQNNPCPIKARYAYLKLAPSVCSGLEITWKNHG